MISYEYFYLLLPYIAGNDLIILVNIRNFLFYTANLKLLFLLNNN
jgi:hypothetical protein